MAEIEFLDPGPWQHPPSVPASVPPAAAPPFSGPPVAGPPFSGPPFSGPPAPGWAPQPDAGAGWPPTPPPGWAPPPRRSPLIALRLAAPPLLFLAAATLAVLAPFRMLSRVGGQFGGSISSDGWGRVHGESAPFTEHDPRFGVLTCVAAGLLLIAAGLALLAVLRRRWARLGAVAAGLLGGGLALGVLGATLFDVQATRDNINNEVRYEQAGGQSPERALHVAVGWFTWLLLIAVGCALLGALLAATAPRRAPAPAAPPPPPPLPPLHPQDELLGAAGHPPIG